MSAFDEKHPQDQRAFLDKVEAYVSDRATDRERAAEQRHVEITGRLDLILAALAAGARAFADAVDRGPRR